MQSSALLNSEGQTNYIKIAIVASISLHVLFIIWLWASSKASQRSNAEIVFSVELAPPAPSQKTKETARERKQIVEQPQKSLDEAVQPKQVFESDQDNYSFKEQIRRGDDGKTNAQASTENQQPAVQPKQNPAPKTKQVEEPKNLDAAKPPAKSNPSPLKLKLDNSAIADISASDSAQESKNSAEEKLQQEIQSSLSRNEKSSINVGRIGSRDYITDIPDGEVTLLNTKANKYAVFVRRVASQVFANLRGSGWQSLNASDIRGIAKDASYEAILSAKGDLISVNLTTSSESRNFDRVLGSAIQKGAKDPNPPAGAEAEDGKIHFIFQAKSWVDIRSNNRTGAPMERRWLVLGTGLE